MKSNVTRWTLTAGYFALGKLGALGHSQGAGGALNAMIDSIL